MLLVLKTIRVHFAILYYADINFLSIISLIEFIPYVPMIFNDIVFPGLELLQMDRENFTSSEQDMSKTYSFLAFMLIYPFRTIADLNDDNSA